jgi:streptogramin lyase
VAVASNGTVWFTQSVTGNIARITPNADGTITFSEGRSVKYSGPFGITISPGGNPWYTMLDANKIVAGSNRLSTCQATNLREAILSEGR